MYLYQGIRMKVVSTKQNEGWKATDKKTYLFVEKFLRRGAFGLIDTRYVRSIFVIVHRCLAFLWIRVWHKITLCTIPTWKLNHFRNTFSKRWWYWYCFFEQVGLEYHDTSQNNSRQFSLCAKFWRKKFSKELMETDGW